jgi:hypothetical protein
VKQPNKLFWTSLLLYAFSFCLLATWSEPPMDGRMPGFFCAIYAFVWPLHEIKEALLHNVPYALQPLPLVSLFISGCINPIFVAMIGLNLVEYPARTTSILKIALILMMPFTIVFFATFRGVYPREGYFLWVIAMLLALFSEQLSDIVNRDDPAV